MKVKVHDKSDGKHFEIHYGYKNPDMFPKDHEWAIWTTGLASTLFMIFWFWHVKRGTEEINKEIRFVLNLTVTLPHYPPPYRVAILLP